MSKLGNRKGPDASFTKLAVQKFPEKATLEERLDAMRGFMSAHFPKISATFAVRHRGDWKDRGKNRTMSAAGIIDVGDPDVREFVLRQIETKNLEYSFTARSCQLFARSQITPRIGILRALVSAAEMLKKEAGMHENNIEIVWDSRAVTVRKEEAFKQPKGQGLGTFRRKFTHLTL